MTTSQERYSCHSDDEPKIKISVSKYFLQIFTTRDWISRLFIFTSLWCSFEFIISPYPFGAKRAESFPSIALAGARFNLSELLIWLFIGFTLLTVLTKINRRGFIVASSDRHFWSLTGILLLPTITSILIGIISGNKEAVGLLFQNSFFIIFPLFFFIRKIIGQHNLWLQDIFWWTGFINAILAIVQLFSDGLSPYSIPSENAIFGGQRWFGLYTSVFPCLASINAIIWDNTSFSRLAVALICFFAIFFNITAKVVVFALAIGIFISLTCTFYLVGLKKVLSYCGLFIIFLLSVIAIPSEYKILLTDTFTQRFLKIQLQPDFISNIEISDFVNLIVFASNEKDISAGRFELWKEYFSTSLHNPIVSPNFGEYPKVFIQSQHATVDNVVSHNILLHFAYNYGLLTGILIAIFILCHIIFGLRHLLADRQRLGRIQFSQDLTTYSYSIAIIAASMVGDPYVCSRFIWFISGLLVCFYHCRSSINEI